MDEHTPGPWVWRANTAGQAVHLFGPRGVVVMAFQRWGMRGATPAFRDAQNLLSKAVEWAVRPQAHNPWNVTDIDHPDARLIAAAPELLAALEGVISEIGAEWDDSWSAAVYEEAVAAVAKARGE